MMDGALGGLPGLFEVADEMDRHMDVTHDLTLVPNAVGMTGTLLLGWGYPMAVALTLGCWLPQLAWVALPRWRHRGAASEPATSREARSRP